MSLIASSIGVSRVLFTRSSWRRNISSVVIGMRAGVGLHAEVPALVVHGLIEVGEGSDLTGSLASSGQYVRISCASHNAATTPTKVSGFYWGSGRVV